MRAWPDSNGLRNGHTAAGDYRMRCRGRVGSSPWRKKANVSMPPRVERGEPRCDLVEFLVRVVSSRKRRYAQPACPLVVVDPHRARLGEPLLDAVPGRIAQVERVADARVGRAEQQLEKAVVSRALDDDADAAEPVAEARTRSSNVASRRSSPSGALTAKRKPSGTCAAHERNCSSDGSRYLVAFSSTVGSCAA